MAGLLGLELTDNHEVMTTRNIDTNTSTGSGGSNYDYEPDFSVVGKQHTDD